MTIQIVGTTIEVLGKTFQMKCPESEVAALQKAAEYLEEKMREVREMTHVLSIDRIAVIAALNIAHQFLNLERENYIATQALNDRLRDLQARMETMLAQSAQMELHSAE